VIAKGLRKSSLALLFLRRELEVFSPFGKGGLRGI
jgi:hypothetical protein